METGSVPASPIELTARQRAWLKALGISKPWLPPTASSHAAAKPVAAAHDAALPPSSLPSQGNALPQAVSKVFDDHPLDQVSDSALFQDAGAPEFSQDATVRQSLVATDLQSLDAQILNCDSCGLCRERTHAVPGQGVMRPSIMVVGEAPGEQEDRQGLPFVGRSGQLLDNMLAAISHRRDANVYITNVVKCRPPGNRNPDAQEIASCSSYLMRQLALIQPQAILAMGRFAAQTLLKKEASMQALRGQVHFVDVEGRQVPVVATYHPAYLLRRPVEKASAWQDLKRIEALVVK